MTPQEEQPQQLPPSAIRFLCVCEGGNCRSVALALMLKATKQHDAIACSWKDISEQTFHMLAAWADAIIVMEAYMAEKIPEPWQDKLNILDVGVDVWANPFNQELWAKIGDLLKETHIKIRPLSPIRLSNA